MEGKNLVLKICQNDPLFTFLSRKRQLKPGKLALGIAILSCAALWTELSLAKLPFSQSVPIVSFQAFVIFPLCVILYFAVPNFLAKPFMILERADSIGEGLETEDEEQYSQFRARMISSLGSFVWIGLAAIMILYYWYYRLFTSVPSDPSQLIAEPTRTLIRIALLVIYSPLLYMGILTLGRILVGVPLIGRFFRSFQIQVNPLSPDGAGGIGFVGQMLIDSALIATAFGAAATGLVYVNLAAGNNPLGRVEIIILSLIYLVLTPLLFFSLMWAPHRALVRAREAALKPLADEYREVSLQEIHSRKKNVDAIKSKTDHLIEIKRQYQLIEETFPVWPLDTRSLRGLLATSILPAVSTLFSGFISNLWKTLVDIINKP